MLALPEPGSEDHVFFSAFELSSVYMLGMNATWSSDAFPKHYHRAGV